MYNTRRLTLRLASGFSALALGAALTGCGMAGSSATSATSSSGSNIGAFHVDGKVHGGLQPVTGALIQLYEIGATGYTSAAKPILTSTVTTDGNGSFNITGKYTCDTGSYVYITAAGGNTGSGTNNNSALMAALGSCSNLLANAASTTIFMNEVTTVAAAYALAQFSGGTAYGTTLVTKPGTSGVTPPADNFATSATNVQGVANAMAVASVLANTSTGTSGNNSNATATPEYWTLYTIADILSACVNSPGGTAGDGSNCGKLFTYTTPTGGVAPADTIQAALQLALHPADANLLSAGTTSYTGGALFSLISSTPPYTPYVLAGTAGNSITDWTIGVSYSPVKPTTATTLLAQTNYVAIDGYGNAWVTNLGGTGGKAVVELAPNGDPIQAGASTGLYAVTQYAISGTATNNGGPVNATSEFSGIALDTSNNAWVADTTNGYLFKIGASAASFGVNGEVATSNGGGGTLATSLDTGSRTSHPVGVAIDGSNNVYTALYGNGGVAPAGGTPAQCGNYTSGTKNLISFLNNAGTYGSAIFGSSAGSNQTYIAIDNATQDTVGGTAIPGAPFVWWFAEASGGTETHGGVSGHYDLLYQASTASGGNSLQGCNTAVGSISSSNTASSHTTSIAAQTVSGSTVDFVNNAFAVAFDSANNLWTANQVAVSDAAGYTTPSFTRLTPVYGGTTAAPTLGSSTFANYFTGGISAIKPLPVAIDGAGNAYAANNSGNAAVAAVSNTGVGLAPSATGFAGATYSPDAGTTSYKRTGGTASGIAVDLSGNLWVTNGTAASTNINQIVGVAVPTVTPLSTAVANSSLGKKP